MALSKKTVFIEMKGKQISVEDLEKSCKAEFPKVEYIYLNTEECKAYCLNRAREGEPVVVDLMK